MGLSERVIYNYFMARFRKQSVIKGQIIIEGGAHVWSHELFIATALSNVGYTVRFIPEHGSVHSADAYLNNTIFEFKAPEGSTVKAVERNLVRALSQSSNIVISTVRMKKIQDRSVESFLIRRLREGKGIRHLIFVTREGKVIDINNLA